MKRTLSLILALSLVFSLAPMALATGDAGSSNLATLTYNFGAAAYGSQTELTKTDLDAKDKRTLKVEDLTASTAPETPTMVDLVAPEWATVNTEPWRIDAQSTWLDVAVTSTDVGTDTKKVANAIFADAYYNKSTYLSVVLFADEVGTFDANLTYVASPNSAIYDIYLIPRIVIEEYSSLIKGLDRGESGIVDDSRYMDDWINSWATAEQKTKYKLTTLDMYAEEKGQKTVKLTSCNIDAIGEYYLLFAGNGTNEAVSSNDHNYINLHSFELKQTNIDKGVRYNFGALGYKTAQTLDLNSNDAYLPLYGPDIEAKKSADVWATYNTQPWMIVGAQNHYSSYRGGVYLTPVLSSANLIRFNEISANSFGFYVANGRVGQDIFGIIKLDAPAAGAYVPELTYLASPNDPKYNIYLIPGDALGTSTLGFTGTTVDKTILKEEYKLGTIDSYAETAEIRTAALNSIKIDETKDYYLVLHEFEKSAYHDKGKSTVTEFLSFNLIPQEIGSVAFSYDKNMTVGKKQSVAGLSCKDKNGKAMTDGYTMGYKSDNKAVATVDASGVVRSIAPGVANITVTATDSFGNKAEGSVAINVAKYGPTDTITFDFGAEGYGKTAEIAQGGNSPANAEENPESLNAYDRADPPVWANIGTAPWRVDGFSYTSVSATAAATEATDYKKADALYFSMGKVRAYDKTNKTARQDFNVAMNLNIDAIGTVTPKLTYATTKLGAKLDFYIIPKSEQNQYNSDTMDFGNDYQGDSNVSQFVKYKLAANDAWYLGSIDTYSAEPGNVTATFDNYLLPESGEYYLAFRCNGVNDALDNGYDGGYLHVNLYSLDLVPVSAQDLAEDAFAPTVDETYDAENTSVVTFTVYGDGEETEVNRVDATAGNAIEVSAQEEKDGYKFLYWVRGNSAAKQIVSHSASFNYVPFEGANYLLAVYGSAEDTDTVEFYNANGQPLDLALEGGNLPDYPSMAGYGKATGWAMRTENGGSVAYKAGDAAPESGERIFVATYDEPQETIIINGENYAYGDVVTCISDDANFSYWTKKVNGKETIASVSKTYTFNAWESCTVTPVCKGAVNLGAAARKIILGTFSVGNDTAVMAEFIGFGDATEKGIIVNGTQYIPMQTGKNMFTVIGDLAGDYVGYAVVDGVKYTDGIVTVTID